MKIYVPNNWELLTSKFPIIIEYIELMYPRPQTTVALIELINTLGLEDMSDIKKEVLNISHIELYGRLDLMGVRPYTRTGQFIKIESISSHELYKLKNWEECQKEEISRIEKKLTGKNFLYRIHKKQA